METTSLYHRLLMAYSDENLNKISAWIIDLYKNKQFLKIRKLSELLSGYLGFDDFSNMGRCFTKLISTYHPDKGTFYRNKITRLFELGQKEELDRFCHIFIVQNEDNVKQVQEETIDIGFEYEYEFVWDYESEGYQYFNDIEDENDPSDPMAFYQPVIDGSFYSAVKRKIYGNSQMEFPVYYLEDLDEINMAEYEIENLDGIEHCPHVTKLDLSGNNLTDITDLYLLKELEELFISGNQIEYLDSIGFLKKMKVLDLSHNYITDVMPLLRLDNLDYVNLVGNQVPNAQVQKLMERNVLVVL